MQNKVATLLLVLLASHSLIAQPPAPQGMQWEKVEALSDEFDKWDKSKWKKSLWNYGVPVQMVAKNSGVDAGVLWIKTTLDEKEEERWFKTSRVVSKTKISYPMYAECSMKANSLSSFNTFWLNNGNSYNRDEIDMCESNARPSLASKAHYAYTLNSQYFVVKDSVTKRAADNFNSHNLSEDNPYKGVNWDLTFHTIGIWWKDSVNIQFYLNGEEAGSVIAEVPFTRELDMIWDVWTSYDDWTGGIANKENLNDDCLNTMYVDWVHTYKLVKTNE